MGSFARPLLQKAYTSLVSVLAALCIYATLNPAFRRRKYRITRTLMYVGLGLSFIIPFIHDVVLFGWETQY